MKVAIVLVLLLSGCNVLGTGSFFHSMVTGNTVGTATGVAGLYVEENTGKSPLEHILYSINPPPKPKPKPKEGIVWSYEIFSKVLNEE